MAGFFDSDTVKALSWLVKQSCAVLHTATDSDVCVFLLPTLLAKVFNKATGLGPGTS